MLEMVVDGLSSSYGITTDFFLNIFCCFKRITEITKKFTSIIKMNRKEVRVEFHPNRKCVVHSSDAVFSQDIMVISYVPKCLVVALLSTKHSDLNLTDEEHHFIPKVIFYHNHSKEDVDRMDQMVGVYSCLRNTKRWPLVLFFYVADIAAINVFTVFT